MHTSHIVSNTYINTPAILIVTAADRNKAINFETAYEKEADEISDFLRRTFCIKTLRELATLLQNEKY